MAGAPRFSDIERRAYDATSRAAKPAQAARAVITAADAFLAEVTASLNLAANLAGLACSEGCDACCHQMVGITSAEAALLADAIAALPEPRRTETIGRVKASAAASAGMGPAEWWKARLPCPLLENGRCTVHTSRPLPCRAMNSADADICRRAFAGDPAAARIPILAAQHGVYGHAQAGLARALGGGAKPLAQALAGLFA